MELSGGPARTGHLLHGHADPDSGQHGPGDPAGRTCSGGRRTASSSTASPRSARGPICRSPAARNTAAFLTAYLAGGGKEPGHGASRTTSSISCISGKGFALFGGCAGFGCSAAFNFVAVLPDGEVHACRKLPSPLGNILETSLLELYDSETAQRYRAGTAACRTCPIRPVCGGCLAVAYGMGLDIFQDRDPFCFIES